MEILFITSMSVIAADPAASRGLFVDALGLPLHPDATGEYFHSEAVEYFHSEAVEGAKHFGVWPLAQAAKACFGTAGWPADRPVPQASVEFEVRDAAAVAAAERELVAAGHDLLHPTKTEPWGQTVARFQTADGAIVGVSYAPSLH